jgi:drug/metabolite transporter (DMT)-like permease
MMVAAIVLFTLLDAVAKELTARYPVAQVVWARIAVQLALVVLVLNRHLPAYARTRWPVLHLGRAATQLGASAFFFAALPHIGLAEATALADLNPVLITLGAALFLGERIGPRRLAGVFVALAGALIIIRPGAAVFTPAALLPLCCALCYAANALITRAVGARESVWTAMLLTSTIATALATVPLVLVAVPVAAADLPAFLAIGVLGTLAQLALIRAFSLAEAGAVAPFSYLGIVLACLWGLVFFGERPDGWTMLGAAIIAGAGLYVWHRETRAGR